MPRKYRPSNGTEGAAFMEAFCFQCERDKDEDCPIVAATMAFDVDNERYPEEWQQTAAGPTCTAFLPLGDPVHYKDDRTIDMFDPQPENGPAIQ